MNRMDYLGIVIMLVGGLFFIVVGICIKNYVLLFGGGFVLGYGIATMHQIRAKFGIK